MTFETLLVQNVKMCVLPQDSSVIEIRDGKVKIDGKDYVELKNVPFAGNNEEYNNLKDEIVELGEDLEDMSPDNPRYAKKAERLLKLKEKIQTMESSLWDTALMITHLSTTKCSERLERAMQLFNKGDNKGALAVLNEEEIDKDAQHNINLIKLGESGREGLRINIQEYEMRVSSLESEMSPGWLQKVIKLREKILEWVEILHGNKSEEYCSAALSLGISYEDNGDYSEALNTFSTALDVSKSLFGERHRETAVFYNNIGVVYDDLGEYSKSIEYYLKALAILEAVFGEPHPDTAGSYDNIGNAYGRLGEYAKSLEYHLSALSIREAVLGEQHPDTAISYNNIGVTYDDLGEHTKSLEYYLRALSIHEAVLGEQHPDTAASYNNIGVAYGRLGEYAKSLEYLLRAMSICEVVMGEQHPDTAAHYNNIGVTYDRLGKYAKSLEYRLRALSIREAVLGEQHPDTARSFYPIGLMCYKIDDMDKAEYYFGKAAVYDDADAWNELSYVYFRKGETDKALEAIDKAIALESSNPRFIDSKGEHLFNLGRYDDAKAAWMEVVRLDPDRANKANSALFKGLKSKGII